jgi:hypothetical protein
MEVTKFSFLWLGLVWHPSVDTKVEMSRYPPLQSSINKFKFNFPRGSMSVNLSNAQIYIT